MCIRDSPHRHTTNAHFQAVTKGYVVSYSPPKYSSTKPRWLDAAAAAATSYNIQRHSQSFHVTVISIITIITSSFIEKEWMTLVTNGYTQHITGGRLNLLLSANLQVDTNIFMVVWRTFSHHSPFSHDPYWAHSPQYNQLASVTHCCWWRYCWHLTL